MGQSGEIGIARLLGARPGDIESMRVGMTPHLGVAIRKTQRETEIVPVRGNRRKIEPNLPGWIRDEEAVVDTPFVFIQKHPQFGRTTKV